ncbi:MAG: hypothetical protein KUG77_14100 [Nannocystaceae bacterium]|nr:hypothetical protein [Nannocystaceae bacterium]
MADAPAPEIEDTAADVADDPPPVTVPVVEDIDASDAPPTPEPDPEAAAVPGPEPGDDADVSETEPAAETSETSETSEPDGGELSMDDIFGTVETLENVEGAQTPGEGPAPQAPTPARARTRRSEKDANDDLDFNFRVVTSAYFDVAGVEERTFSRNENRLEFTLRYSPNKHIQLVGNVEPVFLGVAQAQFLDDLATRQLLTPFHVESDAAYVAVFDLLPKLDLKIGRQIVQWGTADRFNPTNNINPDDLEDRPLFTEPIANQMVVVDFAPLDDKLWFEAVYVPLFYPALLPPSAAAGLEDPQSPVPFARESDVAKIEELQATLDITPSLVPTVVGRVRMPKRRFSDGQSAIKLGTSLGGVDASISYYNGRHDIPTPLRVNSETKDPQQGPVTDEECCYRSDVILNYPRMQVLGLDFATQLPFLRDMGLWGEGAMFFPTAQELYIEFPIPVDVTPDDDLLNPVDQLQGPAIDSRPYIKATAGFDYTFGKHVYVQAQYLRGFIDEFGADHIGNYFVGGTELVFFGRHLLFRAFGVVDFPTGPRDHGSYVIYPELVVVPPWGSITFDIGSFFLVGSDDTKFGQPAAGSSIVFTKVTGAF